ncbi:transmembrane efflux protein [Streptomyces sp. NL15-2K]|nr:transmembrane efflux protein [Streptomyces sp. NL15-2K]
MPGGTPSTRATSRVDLWGRKRTFVTGLIGFAGAFALGGAATNEAMLLGSRALQGAFGALLAPAALSLLAVMFTDAKECAKAFGIYGAFAGGGGAVGLILGGFLTEDLDWRWTFSQVGDDRATRAAIPGARLTGRLRQARPCPRRRRSVWAGARRTERE